MKSLHLVDTNKGQSRNENRPVRRRRDDRAAHSRGGTAARPRSDGGRARPNALLRGRRPRGCGAGRRRRCGERGRRGARARRGDQCRRPGAHARRAPPDAGRCGPRPHRRRAARQRAAAARRRRGREPRGPARGAARGHPGVPGGLATGCPGAPRRAGGVPRGAAGARLDLLQSCRRDRAREADRHLPHGSRPASDRQAGQESYLCRGLRGGAARRGRAPGPRLPADHGRIPSPAPGRPPGAVALSQH